MIERCIRDREGRIVGYLAGYSNAELQSLLRRHASEGKLPPEPPEQSLQTSSTRQRFVQSVTADVLPLRQTLRRLSRLSSPAIRKKTASFPRKRNSSFPIMRSDML